MISSVSQEQHYQNMPAAFAAAAAMPSVTPLEIPDLSTLKQATLINQRVLKASLSNSVQVLIVSDPSFKNSAASVRVNVGSFNNPEDQLGVAHYLEHMLFMGSEKYPEENDWHQYVTERGGGANAYTAYDHTLFYFDTHHESFLEVLEKFSWFFRKPLFNASSMDREKIAVNQEYLNLNNNTHWQTKAVLQALSLKSHPFSRFEVGSLETLKEINQEQISRFFQHYGSDKMTVVVVTAMNPETILPEINSYFGSISPSSIQQPAACGPALDPQYLGSLTVVNVDKELFKLVLTWDIPLEFIDENRKPSTLASHYLGDESRHSLLSYLKKKAYATALVCGKSALSPQTQQFFIDITLTQKGLKNKNRILRAVFASISRLQNEPYPSYLYDEIQEQVRINYMFESDNTPEEKAVYLGRMLGREDLSTFPDKTLLIPDFDPELVQRFGAVLKPQNAMIQLVIPKRLASKNGEKEPWFKASYEVSKMDEETLVALEKTGSHRKIRYPDSNPFMPTNLDLVVEKSSFDDYPIPKLLVDNAACRLYHMEGHMNQSPKAYLTFQINCHHLKETSARKEALKQLYLMAFEESVSNLLEPAFCAGMTFSFKSSEFGFKLNLDGYQEPLLRVLSKVTSKLDLKEISEKKFTQKKAELIRRCKQMQQQNSHKVAQLVTKKILVPGHYTPNELLAEIQTLSHVEFTLFHKGILLNSSILGLTSGNITSERAIDCLTILEKGLPQNVSDLALYQSKSFQTIQQPEYIAIKSKGVGNGMQLTLHNADKTHEGVVSLNLLQKALDSLYFDALRTKEQTGYTVYSIWIRHKWDSYLLLTIESHSHLPKDLLARTERFLDQLCLEPIKQDFFEKLKQAEIKRMEHYFSDCEKVHDYLWNALIESRDFSDFARELEIIRNLSYKDFLDFCTKFLSSQNRERLAVLVKGRTENLRSVQFKKSKKDISL